MNEPSSKISALGAARHALAGAVDAPAGAATPGRLASAGKPWIAASMRLAADLAALPPLADAASGTNGDARHASPDATGKAP